MQCQLASYLLARVVCGVVVLTQLRLPVLYIFCCTKMAKRRRENNQYAFSGWYSQGNWVRVVQLTVGVFAVGGHALTRCLQDSTGSVNVFMLEWTFIKLNNDNGREYELCLSVWYKAFVLLIYIYFYETC
jgi:hypothetical protein